MLLLVEFLLFFEDVDLVIQVGEWVICEVLFQVIQWWCIGIVLCISVNVFVCYLLQLDFVINLVVILEVFFEVGQYCLQIEIVEIVVFKEFDIICQVIEDCGKLGVIFLFDDFGMGYLMLVYFRYLLVCEIKIDQFFVCYMLSRLEDMVIVEVVIGMGCVFGCFVVVEGVESMVYIKVLLVLGCDVFQGYVLVWLMVLGDFLFWICEFKLDLVWYLLVGKIVWI